MVNRRNPFCVWLEVTETLCLLRVLIPVAWMALLFIGQRFMYSVYVSLRHIVIFVLYHLKELFI